MMMDIFEGIRIRMGRIGQRRGVQRGSIEYLFKYAGDLLTPGVASEPDLPAKDRLKPEDAPAMPKIPTTPLSYHDAAPILEALGGPNVPHAWQAALPFAYHVGGQGNVRVHMLLKMDYSYRKLWDVIGMIPGSEYPKDWVIAGNHRDAWTFGAVDPNSGTVAMLEAAHGLGVLLKTGWRPKRTIYLCSWDGEEEGLIGSMEWAEDHAAELKNAVAYFNTDVGVSGTEFNASAVPSLKAFIWQITKEVPSPKGGTVYEQWRNSQQDKEAKAREANNGFNHTPYDAGSQGVKIGDLGSGPDYTSFIQHLGVLATDIGSDGPYGVYHLAFDDFSWFVMNADPKFVYEQEMARVFGLEVLHMADAEVLPYDSVNYGKQSQNYLKAAAKKIEGIDFDGAIRAAEQFMSAAEAVSARQESESGNLVKLNAQLRQVEEDMLNPQGLPGRPWFKHTIYVPGEYTRGMRRW
jgi:N-acetylated-alpha-linked acidic dipeptidase